MPVYNLQPKCYMRGRLDVLYRIFKNTCLPFDHHCYDCPGVAGFERANNIHTHLIRKGVFDDPSKLLAKTSGRIIRLNPYSDSFGEWNTMDMIEDILLKCFADQKNFYLVRTRRWERAAQFFKSRPSRYTNICLEMLVRTQKDVDAAAAILGTIALPYKAISLYPIMEQIDISEIQMPSWIYATNRVFDKESVNFKPEWIEDIADTASRRNVPFWYENKPPRIMPAVARQEEEFTMGGQITDDRLYVIAKSPSRFSVRYRLDEYKQVPFSIIVPIMQEKRRVCRYIHALYESLQVYDRDNKTLVLIGS